ncbi:MAG: T9SS type A sorting domain-containing protein [Elusimicrobia bacterium]|nr:T9SS type A sorting domain-containing protein [Elusimicrobiota bacterium]
MTRKSGVVYCLLLVFFCARIYADFFEIEVKNSKPFVENSRVKIQGCEISNFNNYALPVKKLKYPIPHGFSFEKIELVELEKQEIFLNIKPFFKPRPLGKVSPSYFAKEEKSDFFRFSIQKRGKEEIIFLKVFGVVKDGDKFFWIKKAKFKVFLKGKAEKSIKAQSTILAKDGYLLITDPTLLNSFSTLLSERAKKFSTYTITVDEISTSYSGVDEQEKIRSCIKDFYSTRNVKFVLLGGDVGIIPARGVYAKVSGATLKKTLAVYEDTNIPCDLYYADLTGNWNQDGDNLWGEVGDGVDFIPEVFVGRASVESESEVLNFVDKVISYPKENNYKNLLIGAQLDTTCDGKDITEEVVNFFNQDFENIKMYESDGTLSETLALEYLNTGVDYVNHAGHGDWNWLQLDLDINKVHSLTNTKAYLFYSIGCYAGSFDNSDCIGEELVINEGGAGAFIGNSRYGWYDEIDATLYSGEFMSYFYEVLFSTAITEPFAGEVFALSKEKFISDSLTNTPYRWLEFCLNFIGDPAMILPQEKKISITALNTSFETEEKISNQISLSFENLSSTEIKNVSVTIETDDPYTVISSSYAFLGDFLSGATKQADFDFYVDGIPSEHKIYFNVYVSGDNATAFECLSVTVYTSPQLLKDVYCWPNPSRGEDVSITNIPLNSEPILHIYDLSGREIITLKQGDGIVELPKSYKAVWKLKNFSGRKIASGIYYYYLETNKGTKQGKIAIIR